MRTLAQVQSDLDAVAREFPDSRGSLLRGTVNVAVRRTGDTWAVAGGASVDFVKENFLNGGAPSASELAYAAFSRSLGITE